MTDFWINDEDFLLNEKRRRGYLEAIRKTDLPPPSISIFSSVKGLSQFTATELVEMGIDWVWVGYEGQRAGYSKMAGKPYGELFVDLHAHGISVLASMIIGFDYQTPEIIEEEFEELMCIRPSMCQFLIYVPAYGTPLYERMDMEGRLIPEAYENPASQDGFSLGFRHPHIEPEEMAAIQRRLYREDFARLGPGIFRVTEDWLEGLCNLRDHPAPRVRAKAQAYAKAAHEALVVLPASKKYLNGEVCRWLDRFGVRLEAETGPMTFKENVVSKFAPLLLWYTDFKIRHGIGAQPESTRRTYRQDPLERH